MHEMFIELANQIGNTITINSTEKEGK